MTYSEMVKQLLDLAGADEGDDLEDMVKAAINRAYHRVLQKVNADHERRVIELTTRASQSKYGLPLGVDQVLNIEDPANDRTIEVITPREFDNNYPGNTDAGDPDRCYFIGSYGVQRQLEADGKITVVSTSASDITNYYVRLVGYSGDVLLSEQLTLTGTTPVQSSNTFDAGGVQQVIRTSGSGNAFNGNTVVTDGTNTLTTIPSNFPANYSPSHTWYEFHPIPGSAKTYNVRVNIGKPDLVNDDDWPDIDHRFHSLLIYGAGAEFLPVVGKSTVGGKFAEDFENGIREFQSFQETRQPFIHRQFADITTMSTWRRRPRVKGVDY